MSQLYLVVYGRTIRFRYILVLLTQKELGRIKNIHIQCAGSNIGPFLLSDWITKEHTLYMHLELSFVLWKIIS